VAKRSRYAEYKDGYANYRFELSPEGILLMQCHTEGDSLVWFRGSDVIAAGDIYSTVSYPVIDVKHGGTTIPAVAVINKPGLLFLFDRVTGKPIYGVEERPVPQTEVPLERTAKTQPFPVKPAPLSRMTMAAADIATVTPELEAACRKLMEGVQLGGPYLPVSYNRLRVQFPGNHGGVNWGGASFNPQLGYLFVNTNEVGQLSGLRDRDPNQTGPAQGDGQGNRVDPDGPYPTARLSPTCENSVTSTSLKTPARTR